uniref:Uncharacterized protein n=1 Tax=Anguilla anguilla TaxID=7936 RepID=A0A0E9VUZ8_ANGAN
MGHRPMSGLYSHTNLFNSGRLIVGFNC